MHVGMSVIFQNPSTTVSDAAVYRDDLALAVQVETLGFDSIWSVEHHFTGYTMCPDVVQFLSYMAGRTQHTRLGTMVIVLPWHDPIRVAEQVTMLDHLSGGRVVLGLGRGLGRVEFEGFRVEMGESRARFVEYAQLVLEALEKGYSEYDGKFIQQPRRDIRPAPFKSFAGRTYAAAVSPESSRIMAELGVGLLIIPQKPWSEVSSELEKYNHTFAEVNGRPPPAPIHVAWTFCDKDEGRAREMAQQYIGGYYQSVIDHYELTRGHFEKTKGYEYYHKVTEHLVDYGSDDMKKFFIDLQVWGTPRQCLDKIMGIRERIGSDAFVAVFSYAGMTHEDAQRNMHTFASEVMPALKREQPRQKAAGWE